MHRDLKMVLDILALELQTVSCKLLDIGTGMELRSYALTASVRKC